MCGASPWAQPFASTLKTGYASEKAKALGFTWRPVEQRIVKFVDLAAMPEKVNPLRDESKRGAKATDFEQAVDKERGRGQPVKIRFVEHDSLDLAKPNCSLQTTQATKVRYVALELLAINGKPVIDLYTRVELTIHWRLNSEQDWVQLEGCPLKTFFVKEKQKENKVYYIDPGKLIRDVGEYKLSATGIDHMGHKIKEKTACLEIVPGDPDELKAKWNQDRIDKQEFDHRHKLPEVHLVARDSTGARLQWNESERRSLKCDARSVDALPSSKDYIHWPSLTLTSKPKDSEDGPYLIVSVQLLAPSAPLKSQMKIGLTFKAEAFGLETAELGPLSLNTGPPQSLVLVDENKPGGFIARLSHKRSGFESVDPQRGVHIPVQLQLYSNPPVPSVFTSDMPLAKIYSPNDILLASQPFKEDGSCCFEESAIKLFSEKIKTDLTFNYGARVSLKVVVTDSKGEDLKDSKGKVILKMLPEITLVQRDLRLDKLARSEARQARIPRTSTSAGTCLTLSSLPVR